MLQVLRSTTHFQSKLSLALYYTWCVFGYCAELISHWGKWHHRCRDCFVKLHVILQWDWTSVHWLTVNYWKHWATNHSYSLHGPDHPTGMHSVLLHWTNSYTAELITVCSHVNVFLSNLAYGLIGQLLTEAFFPTMTYEDYIEKNILQPLGMKNTGFTYTDELVLQYLTTMIKIR